MTFERFCLEMTLCVLICFIKFYVFIFYEIDVGGPNIVYDHIPVGNVWVKFLKDQPRVLEEGPFKEPKPVKTSPKPRRQSTTSRLVDAPSLGGVGQ